MSGEWGQDGPTHLLFMRYDTGYDTSEMTGDVNKNTKMQNIELIITTLL